MKASFSLAAMILIGTLGLSGSALAQTKAPPKELDECTALQQEFDAARKNRASATQFKHAREQRMLGENLCSKGMTADGVKALKSALQDIGISKN